MNDAKKNVTRFFACTAAVAYLYIASHLIVKDVMSSSLDYFPPPDIVLASGRIAVPGAVTSVAFDRRTAEGLAAEMFTDAEEEPSLDEFLTKFFCSACSRNCLILTPRCASGRMRNQQAIELYREMYPHMEVF